MLVLIDKVFTTFITGKYSQSIFVCAKQPGGCIEYIPLANLYDFFSLHVISNPAEKGKFYREDAKGAKFFEVRIKYGPV